MKSIFIVLAVLVAVGGCYFAFSGSGTYDYKGAAGEPDAPPVDSITLAESAGPAVEVPDFQDPPTNAARYTCIDILCGTVWISTAGGSHCPECGRFADDFDLIDDDELD